MSGTGNIQTGPAPYGLRYTSREAQLHPSARHLTTCLRTMGEYTLSSTICWGGNFGSSANKTIECGLYNTSYNVDFAFNNGQPNLSIIIATRLNGVASHAALAMCDPKTTGSPKDASVCSPEAVAYIAVLNALGHMLLGFLEQSHYGHISCF